MEIRELRSSEIALIEKTTNNIGKYSFPPLSDNLLPDFMIFPKQIRKNGTSVSSNLHFSQYESVAMSMIPSSFFDFACDYVVFCIVNFFSCMQRCSLLFSQGLQVLCHTEKCSHAQSYFFILPLLLQYFVVSSFNNYIFGRSRNYFAGTQRAWIEPCFSDDRPVCPAVSY